MSGLRRAFLAVVLPAGPRAWAESAAHSAASIAPDLRWNRPEQRHLTVQFLGAVPDVAPVAGFVADAALRREPFTLSLGGGGAFPNARRASVLWLGVRQGSDQLTDFATSLSSLTSDDRPFRAHLTLGRVKPRGDRDARRALESIPTGELARFQATQLVLMQSTLGPSGAKHETRDTILFSGK